MKRPFEGLGFTFEIIITRILTLAKTHFTDRPDTYRRMESEAKNGSYGVATMVCAIQPAEWKYHVLRNEQHILDVRLLKLIDEWEQGQTPSPTGVSPLQTADAKALADLRSKRHAATVHAKKAAAASHAKHYKMQAEIQAIWHSGKYRTKDECAEQECAHLGMSYSAARKALRNQR